MKNCTCNKEDGIHEWDCAIEVEKRNNLEAKKILDRMAPFFGLEKKKEANGYRWAEKSASPKSRRTKRAPDAAYCRCNPSTCGTIPGTYPARCSVCNLPRR